MKKCPSPTGFFKVENLFGELLTEYLKNIAKNNLGIPLENNLYWGNIKGFIENQKDIKSFIVNLSKKETKEQIALLLEISPDTLDLIKDLTTWVLKDESGAAALSLEVSKNKNNIELLKNSTVYLTQNEYDLLILDGLISDTTEYNIYEENEEV